jgi:hypothetical protein
MRARHAAMLFADDSAIAALSRWARAAVIGRALRERLTLASQLHDRFLLISGIKSWTNNVLRGTYNWRSRRERRRLRREILGYAQPDQNGRGFSRAPAPIFRAQQQPYQWRHHSSPGGGASSPSMSEERYSSLHSPGPSSYSATRSPLFSPGLQSPLPKVNAPPYSWRGDWLKNVGQHPIRGTRLETAIPPGAAAAANSISAQAHLRDFHSALFPVDAISPPSSPRAEEGVQPSSPALSSGNSNEELVSPPRRGLPIAPSPNDRREMNNRVHERPSEPDGRESQGSLRIDALLQSASCLGLHDAHLLPGVTVREGERSAEICSQGISRPASSHAEPELVESSNIRKGRPASPGAERQIFFRDDAAQPFSPIRPQEAQEGSSCGPRSSLVRANWGAASPQPPSVRGLPPVLTVATGTSVEANESNRPPLRPSPAASMPISSPARQRSSDHTPERATSPGPALGYNTSGLWNGSPHVRTSPNLSQNYHLGSPPCTSARPRSPVSIIGVSPARPQSPISLVGISPARSAGCSFLSQSSCGSVLEGGMEHTLANRYLRQRYLRLGLTKFAQRAFRNGRLRYVSFYH